MYHSGKYLTLLWKFPYNPVIEWTLQLRKAEASGCSWGLDMAVIWRSACSVLPIKGKRLLLSLCLLSGICFRILNFANACTS